MNIFNNMRDAVHVFLLSWCVIVSSCNRLTLADLAKIPLSICYSPLVPGCAAPAVRERIIVMDAAINLHPNFPAL